MKPQMVQIIVKIEDREKAMELFNEMGIGPYHMQGNPDALDKIVAEGKKRGIDIKFRIVDVPPFVQQALQSMMGEIPDIPDMPEVPELPVGFDIPKDLDAKKGHCGACAKGQKKRRGRKGKPVNKSRRPDRETIISEDDKINLKIDLNRAKSVDDFLKMI